MTFTLIGLIIAGLAAASVFRSITAVVTVFFLAALLGAAAALFIGPTGIPPGHMALGFLTLAVVIRKNGLTTLMQTVVFPRPGFFLLLFTVWAVFSAFVMPRLFWGETTVFPLRLDSGTIFFTKLLAPSSSNLNQAIYAIANLLVFASLAAIARNIVMLKGIVIALVVLAFAQITFAVLDMLTFLTGTTSALDIIRNGDYAQLYEHKVMGIKRLNGSFPEASAFAGASAAIFAVMFRLWRGNILPFWTGWAAVGLTVCLGLAFSSTGYVTMGVYLLIAYGNIFTRFDKTQSLDRSARKRTARFSTFGPIAGLLAALAVAFRPDLLDPITQIFDSSIVTKLSSDSGVERMSWNTRAFMNFFETWGLGAGLGSVRASSFITAMMGSVGIIGIVLFGTFYMTLIRSKPDRAGGEVAQIIAATRTGCLVYLIGACVSGSTPDLGLMFFAFAGITYGGSLVAKHAARLQAAPALA